MRLIKNVSKTWRLTKGLDKYNKTEYAKTLEKHNEVMNKLNESIKKIKEEALKVD